MDLNLFAQIVYKQTIKLPVQSIRKLWQYLHSPQKQEDFQTFYAENCNKEGLIEMQRFILLTRSFSNHNELELVQLFQFFDLFKIQQLDCQSLYICYDLLISNVLNCRQLFFYTYHSIIINYMQQEQNSSYVLKTKLFQLIFLFNFTSMDIYSFSHMVENCVVNVDIMLALGYCFKTCRHVEGEIV